MRFYVLEADNYDEAALSDLRAFTCKETARKEACAAWRRLRAASDDGYVDACVAVTVYDVPRPFTSETIRRILEERAFADLVISTRLDHETGKWDVEAARVFGRVPPGALRVPRGERVADRGGDALGRAETFSTRSQTSRDVSVDARAEVAS